MYALQESDPAMWQYFMEGHFAIKKNEVPFTSIGVDHAQEHTNRDLKGDNALKGMANNAEAILNYCLAAPEIQKISSEFEEMIGLTVWTRKEHHQLSKATVEQHEKNVSKLREVLLQCNPFDCTEDDEGHHELYNMISKVIIPEEIKKDILDTVGRGGKITQVFC